MDSLGHVTVTSWSGGRFMHFGQPISEDALLEHLTPGRGIDSIVTADVYAKGDADSFVGRAVANSPRDSYNLVGIVGHDFYEGKRSKGGYQRFTHPELRGPEKYEDFLKMATERSLERCGVHYFDSLLLHNPDRIGYTSDAVWKAMERLIDAGYTKSVGLAPGPANGFSLDILTCLDRFGDMIDVAMVILGPLEPWPTRLILPGFVEHDVQVISRVTDYGGMFWGDLTVDTPMADQDHRAFRPGEWVKEGRIKAEKIAAVGAKHNLTMFQTAASWTLAQPGVVCVAPTVIQEESGGTIEPLSITEKRKQLATVPIESPLNTEELEQIHKIGDNSNCMPLKGASPTHEGEELPDAWMIYPEQQAAAERWNVVPERDLTVIE